MSTIYEKSDQWADIEDRAIAVAQDRGRVYCVVENAGQDGETIVEFFADVEDAYTFKEDHYPGRDAETTDIMRLDGDGTLTTDF